MGTLERDKLPRYLSTEDPSLLDRLLTLGYRTFKMVSQRASLARRTPILRWDARRRRWGDADSIERRTRSSR